MPLQGIQAPQASIDRSILYPDDSELAVVTQNDGAVVPVFLDPRCDHDEVGLRHSEVTSVQDTIANARAFETVSLLFPRLR